jgi:hypothetical protein
MKPASTGTSRDTFLVHVHDKNTLYQGTVTFKVLLTFNRRGAYTYFPALILNKMGNVRINVILRRVRVTTFALQEHYVLPTVSAYL